MYWSCLRRRRRPFLLPTTWLFLDLAWTERSHPTIWIRGPPGGVSIHRGEPCTYTHTTIAITIPRLSWFITRREGEKRVRRTKGIDAFETEGLLEFRDLLLIRVYESRDFPTRNSESMAYASNESGCSRWKVIRRKTRIRCSYLQNTTMIREWFFSHVTLLY